MHTVAPEPRHEPAAMKNTDAKTRAGASTPGAQAMDTGEQLSLELQSESEHQIGTRKEKMIQEAKESAPGPKENSDSAE
jgi:hypothetical protein